MDPVKVGRSIAISRKKYGMTQLDLAERLSVTDKAVSRWERGLGTPDISLLVKLSLILDVDIETLLEGNVSAEDLGWKGVLLLDYPEKILPTDLVYTKRIVYLQIGYFLLAGVTDIMIVGDADNISAVQREIKNIPGLSIQYQVLEAEEVHTECQRLLDYNHNNGLMMISGFDLFYGKDFTKCLRRVMNNCHKSTQICTFEGKPTVLRFYPKGSLHNKAFQFEDSDLEKFFLERGVFHLPVQNQNDLNDAGNFLKILEVHQDEPFMDLEQIMERRHIKSK